MAISSQSEQECSAGSTTRVHDPDRIKRLHERAAVRVCSKCLSNPIFSTSTWCNECQSKRDRERRASDPEYRAKDMAASRDYYRTNRARLLAEKVIYGKQVAERDQARRRERYATDPRFVEKTKLRTGRYYAKKPHVFRARDARRRATQVLATPAWADHKKIRQIYASAAKITKATGIRHEVDHIVPIKGRKASGLHVHFNLRVIPIRENRRKSNKLIEDIV